MNFCPTCGAAIPAGAAFCPSCGAQLTAGEASAEAPAVEATLFPPPAAATTTVAGVTGFPASVALSSSGRRLGAYLLDLFLAVVTLVIGWLIWSLIIWGRGQSPGKQLLKMRVVYLQSEEHVSWGRMAFREVIGKGLIGIVASITLVGYVVYFWLLWDDRRQELWDKMADTIVVDDPDGALA